MMDEIECPDCEGWGMSRFGEPGPCLVGFPGVDICPACNGKGWREPTDEERDDAAANAFSDMCESEPPLSFAEQSAAQAKREAQWGVR
jgi:hypothetical protein